MLTAEDAAYVVVLDRYAAECRELNEPCTIATAARIAELAATLEMEPRHTPAELGFDADLTCLRRTVTGARTRLKASGTARCVR